MQKLLPAFFVSLMVLSLSAQAKTLDWQDMRDWSVTCRDNRYCIAIVVAKSSSGKSLTFKLERGNKENSKVFVTVNPKGDPLKVGMPVSISVVGHEHTFGGEISKVYEGNEASFPFDPTDTSILKMRQGRFAEVVVDFGGSTGKIKYDASLQGVSSVLAMMDVVQGRLDRQDAAVISGGEASFVASHYDLAQGKAPPKPIADEKSEIGKDPEEDIIYPDDDETAKAPSNDGGEESGLGSAQLVYKASELPDKVLMPGYRMLKCNLPDIVEAFGAQVINIEPAVFLYLVPCKNADANVPYYVALETAGEVEILEFQEPASATGKRLSVLINAGWDKTTGKLTGYRYNASSYDCGRYETHNLDVAQNTTYLSEVREKETCDGNVVAPEAWPMTWNGEGQ